MDNKDLLQRIQSLEEENSILKDILQNRSFSSDEKNNSKDKALQNKPLIQNGEWTSYEKYISSLSRQLNSIIDERNILETVLMELASRSGSANLYYLQLDEMKCIITSLIYNSGVSSSHIFSFQENSALKTELEIDLKELYDIGFKIIKKNSSNHFFINNSWLTSIIESVLLLPVIVKNDIFGIIVIDITGKENHLSAVDIMVYQTVSSIVTGSLKRISYENHLKDKKERYELIIENTTHILFQTLPDGTITFANRKFCDYFDIETPETQGKPLPEVISENDSFSRLLQNLNLTPETKQIEVNLQDLNKNRRIIKLSINPVCSDSGKLLLLNYLGEDITEKKLLEEELLATKKRLDLAFLASRDAYWDANLQTGEFYYSQNFYKMLGYESVNMPAYFRDFIKIIHPEDRLMIINHLRQCLDGSITRTSLRFRAITFSGDYKWIFSRAMVIEADNEKSSTRIIGTNVDLTAMVNIEEKLKESETRLKHILDNMPVMLKAIDEAGNFIHWNRECEHVSGYTKDEIINNSEAGSLLYQDEMDRKHFYEMLIKYGGNYRNLEVTLTSKSGVKKTVLWSNLSDLYPVQGWYSWAVGIDITPLNEATKALNESSYKLKEAQRIARLGYWEYLHNKGQFTWDSTLSELLGYNEEFMTLSDREMLQHIHADDRRSSIKKFFECVKDREIHSDVIRYITKSGDIIYIKQTSKTDYDHLGNPEVSKGICFDITELKKTELELVKAKEKAEENNRLKSAFLANMSHEIRTPLNSIMGFSELLGDSEIAPDDKIVYSEIIRDSSRQLTNLISDIIDISKIDANLMIFNKQPVRLNRIMDHTHEIFRNEIRNRNKAITISMTKSFSDNSDIIITDETRLQQILTNLLSNSLKFTDAGTIDFGYSTTDNDRFIQFFVSDTGMGIPKNKQKMIFGRFKQADPAIARKYGGTGLGLSISKELCRLLGGKIWVRSELKKGATFYFKIPYTPLNSDQFTDKNTDIKKTGLYSILKDKKILIVDDNKTVHRLLSAFFEKHGSFITSAETGNSAIELLKNNSEIDIVLLDIQMPDIDGTIVINIIKDIKKDLLVIAQTANALEEDKNKYLKLGFDAYLPKPYNREELLNTVCSLLIKSKK